MQFHVKLKVPKGVVVLFCPHRPCPAFASSVSTTQYAALWESGLLPVLTPELMVQMSE